MALTALDFPASPTVGQVYPDPPVTGQPQYSWNGSQWISSKAAVTQIARTDALGWSGMQVNGEMSVNQAGIVSLGASGYVCDSWYFAKTSSATVLSAATATRLASHNSFIYMAVTGTPVATPAAGDAVVLATQIEGYRSSRLSWGFSSAQPITIAFWCQNWRPGTYSVIIRNNASDRCYAATYTQNVADTAEYKTITVPGCTDGLWLITNGKGLDISFAMSVGSSATAPSANTWLNGNYSAAPGQVNAVASTSDAVRITGVVVLPGIAAPTAAQSPLIMRPYDQELLTCQRYYWKGIVSAGGFGPTGAPNIGAIVVFPTTMRATPTLNWSPGALTNVPTLTVDNATPDGFRVHGSPTNGALNWYGDNLTVSGSARL